MKQIKFYGNKGCALIDGVLTPIKANEVTMDCHGNMFYDTDKKGILKNPVLYYDKERFEKGEPMSIYTPDYDKGYEYEYEEEDGVTIVRTFAWSMIGGEPMKLPYEVDFQISSYRATPILNEGLYKSREDCIRFSTYRYSDKDGNVFEKVGLGKKVQLTGEQMSYIEKELIPMLHKASELGIRLYYNNSTDNIYAVNLNNIENEKKELIMDYTCDVNIDNDPSYITSEAFYKLPYNPIWSESEESCYSE